jgi:hypothetical protein
VPTSSARTAIGRDPRPAETADDPRQRDGEEGRAGGPAQAGEIGQGLGTQARLAGEPRHRKALLPVDIGDPQHQKICGPTSGRKRQQAAIDEGKSRPRAARAREHDDAEYEHARERGDAGLREDRPAAGTPAHDAASGGSQPPSRKSDPAQAADAMARDAQRRSQPARIRAQDRKPDADENGGSDFESQAPLRLDASLAGGFHPGIEGAQGTNDALRIEGALHGFRRGDSPSAAPYARANASFCRHCRC